MLFDSIQANVLLFFSISTLVLWSGPSRLIPGYKDGLPTALTKHGLARGDMWTSRNGSYFNVFRGIPYAKQPIGERRFKPPEALDANDKWEGMRDFNWEMPHCYQIDMASGFHIGKEECLKLNVFSTDMNPEELLPVMVWIHGGAFITGDSGTAMWGPHYFMDHGIVLVTLHYRLGPLGFLSLGNEDISGNMGLWDQRMALQWVKKNIKQFGGDPKRVTIFGESAGSMAVNFHILSPESKGLFSQAIMQSGTVFSSFLESSSQATSYGMRFAEKVGCDKRNKIVECLKSTPVKELYEQLQMFDKDCPLRDDLGFTHLGPWKPVVDSFIEKPFLPKDPEEILKNKEENSVSSIVGFNKEDGLLLSTRFLKDPHVLNHFVENQLVCAPIYLLGKDKQVASEADTAKSEELIQSYSKSGTNTTFAEYTDLFTDAVFAAGSHKLANHLVKNGRKVFKYIFSYQGSTSLGDIFSASLLEQGLYLISRLLRLYPTQSLGACHADDLLYLFQVTPIINMIPTSVDRRVSEEMLEMWVNFATTGEPNNAWRKADLEAEFDYFVIDEISTMETRMELTRLKQWIDV